MLQKQLAKLEFAEIRHKNDMNLTKNQKRKPIFWSIWWPFFAKKKFLIKKIKKRGFQENVKFWPFWWLVTQDPNFCHFGLFSLALCKHLKQLKNVIWAKIGWKRRFVHFQLVFRTIKACQDIVKVPICPIFRF